MSAPIQEMLRFAAAYAAAEKLDELRERVREVIDRRGRKEVCHELDYNRSRLDNILAGRDRNPLNGELVIYAVLIDEEHTLIDWLCGLARGGFVPDERLSWEQKFQRQQRALRRYVSADVAEQIAREAEGRGAK